MRVVIVGAGGHGQVVADILRKNVDRSGDVVPTGFVDDDASLTGREFLGIPVLGPVEALGAIAHDALVVAIGTNERRETICRSLMARGESLIAVIHPSAQIGHDVTVEPGAMICAGAIVNTGSRIGSAAIVNTGATVDHHTIVGSFAHVAPGVHMGGDVRVGEAALVGIGAVVLPGVSIGRRAVVGGGAVVTADVPDGVTVVGVPAKPRRHP